MAARTAPDPGTAIASWVGRPERAVKAGGASREIRQGEANAGAGRS
jgi:hypothetical protein